MAPRILVVDRNEAFATMLEEMLERDGGYEVEVAHAGAEALARLRQADFDLTIMDMNLDPQDMGYRPLIQKVREVRPTMRLMLILMMGEDLPAGAADLGIQGTLSKPFFADDLLPNIQEALSKQLQPPSPPPPQPLAAKPASKPTPPPSAPQPLKTTTPDVQGVLAELARETNADTVLLVSTAGTAWRLVAHVGTLDKVEVEKLAETSVATVQAARAAARLLGQSDAPFEHNMFEGGSLRLYILALPGDLLLVVVVPLSTPLGMIRHNLRRAGHDLADGALT
jgi:CheY-like chemotaxis protein/predicted regulator of Ras-like GTPase activity (Roadblock/LC7/MglB family)